jgi:hypothetical protein
MAEEVTIAIDASKEVLFTIIEALDVAASEYAGVDDVFANNCNELSEKFLTIISKESKNEAG